VFGATCCTLTPTLTPPHTHRVGTGASPEPGDTVVVHWAGYTKGYQGKRIDNTSVRDEPYAFVLGKHEVSPSVSLLIPQ